MLPTLGTNPLHTDTALGRYVAKYHEIRRQQAADLAMVNAVRHKRSDALIKGLFENSFDAIAIFHRNGLIESANEGLARLFGSSEASLNGTSMSSLFVEGGERIAQMLRSEPDGRGDFEATARRSDGSQFPVEIAIGRVGVGDDIRFVAIVRDITDRKAQQDRLRHQALHDALTELPNRVLFNDRLEQALEASGRTGSPLAVLLLDLDRFKEVNDTLGHHVGDLLLRHVAQRLRQAVRKCDTVARLGGDEFAVLFPAVSSEANARELTVRLLSALTEPFTFNGLTIDVGVSTGIAMFPEHARDKDKLLQCADVAMYAAKREQIGIALYTASKDNNSIRNLILAGELRKAIDQRRIFMMYQPKIDLASGTVLGVEALARWRHDDHGVIPPGEFIVEAERTGIIQHLTLLTLELGLSQLAEWRERNLELSLALNVSARSLHDSTLPKQLSQSLNRWQIRPEMVTLEITESALMVDPVKALKVAERLAAMGMRLAIDDFGTGYSSLAYLSSLPVTELKIDKSFVTQMLSRDRDRMIVQSTIDLAHNLGLKVVAEGVETTSILAQLKHLGCDVAQGFLFGKPMSASSLEELLPILRSLGRPARSAA